MERSMKSSKSKKHKHRDRSTRTKPNDVAFDHPESPPHTTESPLTDPSVNKKKTRGNSKKLKLLQLRSGEKLPLEWDMYDCPIRDHATALSVQCGIVVKLPENCPLQKATFLDIDKEKRSRLVDLVMECKKNWTSTELACFFVVILMIGIPLHRKVMER